MYPLTRFFVLTSIVVVAAIAVVTWLHRHSEVQRLINLAERQNVALGQLFANTSWPRVSAHIVSASELSEHELRQRPETLEIQQTIQAASAGLPVIKVKIYGLHGRTVYSTDPAEIGENKANNPGYFAAARDGTTASKLAFRESVSSFEGTIHQRALVESYLPLFKNGDVEGVFELYTDVTPLMTEIEQDTKKLALGFIVVFGLLYAILFPIVRRADRTIGRQYSEITNKNAALQQEVTERERAENALKLTIDNAPVGIVSLDLDGQMTSANAAFCRMLCYTEAELTARRLDAILHPSDLNLNDKASLAAIDSNRRISPVKIRFRRSDAVIVHTEMHLAVAMNNGGRPLKFIAQIADLTDQVELEREMELQRQKLAHVSRLSTLGEMAAGIAHEINQPLTAIATFADGCARLVHSGRGDSAVLTDALNKISGQARRAAEVIRRLRNMVRQGAQEKEIVDINDLVTEVIKLLSTDTRTQSIRIQTKMSDTLAPVEIDKIQIQQVLLNLLRNAVDALESPEDEHMSIAVVTADNQKGEVTVSVVDSGDGVPANAVDKLFSPFFTTKRSGMGIGLSICQSIVQAHGGRLWYTPNPDRGSAFHFALPCDTEREAARSAI
jgi:PAS domain S-box-containing protein